MLNKEYKTSHYHFLVISIARRAAKILLTLPLALSNPAAAYSTQKFTGEEIILLQGLDKLLADSNDSPISKVKMEEALGIEMTNIYCQTHSSQLFKIPHLVTCTTDFITNAGFNRIRLDETFNFDNMRPMEWSIIVETSSKKCINEKTLRNTQVFKWLPSTPRECKSRNIHNAPPNPNCPALGNTFNSTEDIDFSRKTTVTLHKECTSTFIYNRRIKED